MKNAIFKEALREIRRSKNRFISILAIIAVGCGFFAGVKSACPDMKLTARTYFDEHQLYDIQLISTYGFDENDLSAIEQLEGIRGFLPSWYTDVLVSEEGSSELIFRVLADSGDATGEDALNESMLIEGRMPENSNECVVGITDLMPAAWDIGSVIELKDGGDDTLEDTLSTTGYTVVGFVKTPQFFNLTLGSTTIGDGQLDGYLIVPAENFTMDVYTSVYLTLEDTLGADPFSEEYEQAVDGLADQLEAIADRRSDERYEEILAEAEEELTDARKELADGEQELADARKELEDAKTELDDARKELDDGWADYKEGQQTLETEVADGQQELADARKELEDGEQEYQDGLTDYQEGQQKLEDARIELADAKKQLADGEQELADAKKQLEDARKQLEDARAELDDGWVEYEDGKKEFNREIQKAQQQLLDAEQELADGEAQYEQGLAAYQAGLATFQQKIQEELVPSLVTMQNGIRQLDAAIQDGQAKLEANRQQIEPILTGIEGILTKYELPEESGGGDEETGEGETGEGNEESGEDSSDIGDGDQTGGDPQESDSITGEPNEEPTDPEGPTSEEQAIIDAATKISPELGSLLTAYIQATDTLTQQQIADSINTITQGIETELDTQQAKLDKAASQVSALQTRLDAIVAGLGITLPEGGGEGSGGDGSGTGGEEGGNTPTDPETAIAELDKGLAQIETELKAGQKELDEAKAQLDAAKAELDAGKEELEDGWSEFYAGRREGQQQLADAKQQLEDGEEEYAEGLAEYQDGKAKYDAELPDALQKLADARQQIADGEKELADGELELVDAQTKLTDARKELDDGWKELEDGENTLESERQKGLQELADAYQELTDGEAEYGDGLAEYQDGKAEFDAEAPDAEAEIADARQKIEDAEKELADLKKPVWYVQPRYSDSRYSSYTDDAGKVDAVAAVFPVFFVLVAALVCLTAMTRMVEEQRTQIGTLKALGYGRTAIISKYLIYAISASLIGGIVGLLIGFQLFPRVIINAYQNMYQLPAPLTPFRWGYAVACLAVAVLCTGLSAFAACFKELEAFPAKLMRPKAPKAGKRILLEQVGFIWKRLNFTHKVTVRNIFRYKKRVLMTVIGVAGCTALLLTGFGMHHAVTSIATKQYGEIFFYSGMATLDSDYTLLSRSETADYIRQLDGVSEALVVTAHSESVEAEGMSYDANIFVPENPDALPHYINLQERQSGKKLELTDDGVIITEKLSTLTGLKKGDTLNIRIDEQLYQFPIAGIAENYALHYVYISPELYTSVTGKEQNPNTVLFNLDADADQSELSSIILKRNQVLAVSLTSEYSGVFTNLTDSMSIIVWVLILSAGALAVIVMYNLISINVSERTRELATIKVLGFHDNEVSAYICRENTAASLLGMIFGLGLGILLERFVILTAEVDAVMFAHDIPWDCFLWSALLTILFTLGVNLVVHFNLKKINMVESMKAVE